jgi:hypothetical protein
MISPASRAYADAQVSARLGAGGGIQVGPASHPDSTEPGGTEPGATDVGGLFEMLVRAEVLFGGARSDVVRAGPALDLRTRDFVTVEAALGGALLLPVLSGWPVTVGAGLGWRLGPAPAGAFALGTATFGFRSYDFHDSYGFALQLYATGRVDLEDPARWEATAGVEIDLELLFVLPARFLWTLITAGDPDKL